MKALKLESTKMENKQTNFDLHIHSFYSKKYETSGIVDNSTKNNLNLLLKKLNNKKINVFSITDHNTFNASIYIDAKNKIKEFENLKNVIAGVEFNVIDNKYYSNGVHLRIYFDISDDFDLAKKLEEKIDSYKKEILNGAKEDKDFKFPIKTIYSIIEEMRINVIFIFDQNKSLMSDKQDKKEAGNWNFINNHQSWGIITAIETRRVRNRDILEINKINLDGRFGIVYGSDCHSWEEYPSHSSGRNPREKFYFSSLCRPTFLGLMLTIIFPSRMNRIFSNESYIKKIVINENNIIFSKGINVIIGDNGIGKSGMLETLNSETNGRAYKYLEKNNEINFVKKEDVRIKKVSQGALVESHNNNTLLVSKIENRNKIIDNVRLKLIKISNEILFWLRNRIEHNSKIQKIKTKSYILIKTSKNYYPPKKLIEIRKNNFKQRFLNLDLIRKELIKEFSNNIYSEYDGEKKSILNNIEKIIKSLKKQSEVIENMIDLSQIINKSLKKYEEKTIILSTKYDQSNLLIRQKREEFVNTLMNALFDNYESNEKPKIETIIESSDTLSVKKEKSYSLRFEFPNILDKNVLAEIKELLFSKNFNWNEVNNINYLSSNLKRSKLADNWDDFEQEYKSKFNKLLNNKLLKTMTHIEDIRTREIARTFGEVSRLFYENILREKSKNFNVIMIDQPEDNISSLSIKNNIYNVLNSLRSYKQLFVVTHNPILAVNLDPDLIVFIAKKQNKIEIVFGPLDLENGHMIDIISKNMDGGKKSINERMKIYETK